MGEISKNVDIIFRLIDKTKSGAQSIGSAFSTIKANVTKASQQITTFKNTVSNAFKEANLSVTSLGIAMTGLGAGITVPFAAAVKEAGNFEASMSAVKAISGATTNEFKALEEQALTMGRETRYSAEESADALKFMSMAGLEATQSLESLPSVLQLATAGNLDLAESADIATNIMTAYGYEADNLAMVNDRLVTAFTNSNSNLMELGTAFKYVGPIAKGLGAEFDDLISSIAMLHNAGIKGSMAGTTLRGVLDALFNPTKQEAELIAELSSRIGGAGLQIEDAEGNFVGFESLLEQLEQSGITAAEALKLFGQRAGPGMAALVQQGSDELADFNFMMETSTGTAEQIATVMDDNFNGAIKRLLSAISGLAISIGNNFLPVLTSMADGLASLINVLTVVHDAMGPLATILETVVVTFGLLILAIGSATIAYNMFIGPVGKAATILYTLMTTSVSATAGMAGLTGALSAATVKLKLFFASLGPIGWAILGITTAVTGVIAVMDKYKDNSEEVIDKQNELIKEFESTIQLFDRYEAKITRVVKFSEEWVKANKELRIEMLKIAQSESKFALQAQEVANNIDKTTGAMLDNGEAYEKMKLNLITGDFEELSIKINAVAKHLSDVSSGASAWDVFTAKLPDMRKSFEELSEEVESYSDIVGRQLTEDQQKTQAAFTSLMQTARQTVSVMKEMGQIEISTNWLDKANFLQVLKEGFEGQGKNMDLAARAMEAVYDDMVEVAQKTGDERVRSEEETQADLQKKIINGYSQIIANIESSAKQRILAEQKNTAELLANDDLTETQRQKITSDSAEKVLAIELAKYTALEQNAKKYQEALESQGADEKKIQKAAKAQEDASNAITELQIENINLVAETRRTLSEQELAEMEAKLTQQSEWTKAKSDEAIDVLTNEYNAKKIKVQEYYDQRRQLIINAQEEEIAIMQQMADSQTDQSASNEILHEIELKRIENLQQLRDLAIEEKEAKEEAAQAEIEAEEALSELKKQVAETDYNTTYLEKVRAKYEAEELELQNSLDRQIQMRRDAGVSEEIIFDMTIQKEQLLLNKRKQQQLAYYTAIGTMAKSTAGQTADTFQALYEATGEQHKELFYIWKAAAIAEAIISATLGATKALYDPGGYLGMALSALIMAEGMANVAIISSQSMAQGGWVGGVSPNDSADNIGPVWLTAKEYVMPVPVGRKYGDRIMNAFRTGMFPKQALDNILNVAGASVPIVGPSFHLAAGGPVPDQSQQNTVGDISIINIVDPELFSRYTSTEEGKQSIMNVITDKAYEIKSILSNS